MTQRGVARKIGLSPASISRIEDGSKIPTPEEVASLLTVYEIVGPPREILLALTRDAAESGWWQRHNTDYRKSFNTLTSLESDACTITTFELGQIPGLLQGSVYVEALLREDGQIPDEQVRRLIDARMSRQQVMFRKEPVHLSAFIDESALYRMPGSTAVMHRQLEYLLRMTAKSNVIIRVVPCSAGPRAGEIGAFHLIRFTDSPAVVRTANWGSVLYMENAAEIDRYEQAVHWLLKHALDTGESIGLITRLIRKLEADPDVLPQIDWPPVEKEQL